MCGLKDFGSHLTISEIFVILKWMSKKNKNKQIQKNFRHAIAAVNVLVNVAKYKSEGRELVASIVALACSALLAGFVLIHPVVVQMIAG